MYKLTPIDFLPTCHRTIAAQKWFQLPVMDWEGMAFQLRQPPMTATPGPVSVRNVCVCVFFVFIIDLSYRTIIYFHS